ncbi:hypothetical protein BASA81_014001 [Batrachochytrium salamandrivorans]|nr:hypothetical protein BASA81_014001 [Batrachochytrium salamandrivorans]
MKFFECPDCGKRFPQAGGLRSHRTVHTKEKPYECLKCGKVFAHAYDLKCHDRIHTGERPFGCDICGRRFSQSTNLNSHRKLHVPGATLVCNVCGLPFATSEEIIQHRRIHDAPGTKPFIPPRIATVATIAPNAVMHECKVCGKLLKHATGLKYHLAMHENRPELLAFNCELCSLTSFSKVGLFKHIQTVHLG